MYRAPKLRTEAQEVDILRRWIYRAFARELYQWLITAGQRIPMNANSYAQVVAICTNVLAKMQPAPAWTVDIVEPDAQARAQRRGPTVILVAPMVDVVRDCCLSHCDEAHMPECPYGYRDEL
jgi:hypothetical protein